MNQHIRHSFLCLAKRCNFRYTFRAFSFSSSCQMCKSKKTSLLLLHQQWKPMLLTVVTLDARNHGDSEHTPIMDYLTMRDDLLGVMDKLKVEQSILIGHSMGGKTVMTCALTVPERVSSLIVVDTAPKDSPGSDALKVYAQKMKEIPLPSPSTSMPEARREVGNKLKAFVEEESVRLFLLTNLKQSMDNSYFWRVNLDAIIKNFESLHSFPQINEPCSINTIFIGGAESKHVDSTAEPAIHRLFPGTAIERIPQAGHWVHSEKPSEFVELVQKFVLS
ncbi:sn-1-specific diacylglycerol lipase ABHD11-like isoform X2 [Babylonia areolata]|uniref:sn-1-specific diacylglycerol lipase ABHD11-like isoform X2 n=2 Tax=Babylonia areolata TaxID=304850 RepID=UPI003FD2790E